MKSQYGGRFQFSQKRRIGAQSGDSAARYRYSGFTKGAAAGQLTTLSLVRVRPGEPGNPKPGHSLTGLFYCSP
jgi:hypothetical protein